MFKKSGSLNISNPLRASVRKTHLSRPRVELIIAGLCSMMRSTVFKFNLGSRALDYVLTLHCSRICIMYWLAPNEPTIELKWFSIDHNVAQIIPEYIALWVWANTCDLSHRRIWSNKQTTVSLNTEYNFPYHFRGTPCSRPMITWSTWPWWTESSETSHPTLSEEPRPASSSRELLDWLGIGLSLRRDTRVSTAGPCPSTGGTPPTPWWGRTRAWCLTWSPGCSSTSQTGGWCWERR